MNGSNQITQLLYHTVDTASQFYRHDTIDQIAPTALNVAKDLTDTFHVKIEIQ